MLALQEVRTSEASACKLVQHCSRLGYRAWTVSRHNATSSSCHGGLLLAVRKDIRSHFVDKTIHGHFEAITVDLEGFYITNVWERPDCACEASFAEWVAPILSDCRLRRKLWLGVGDHNTLPAEHPMTADDNREGFSYLAVRNEHGELEPTRWDGNRAIDWALLSEPDLEGEAKFDEAFVGDHRCIWYRIVVP